MRPCARRFDAGALTHKQRVLDIASGPLPQPALALAERYRAVKILCTDVVPAVVVLVRSARARERERESERASARARERERERERESVCVLCGLL